MRVLGADNRIYNNQASFGRKPTEKEAKDMQKTINAAYNVMGTKERIAITHGSCFPAVGLDSQIGSPFGKAAKEYIKFLALYGFNGNLLGPNGQLNKGEHSPYASSAFAKNRLFIDLEELKDAKYGHILSENDIDNIDDLQSVPRRTNKNYTYTNFEKANSIYDTALVKAYNNFKTKVQKGQPEALALNKEFKNYLTANNGKNNERLNEEGIFNVLSDFYGTDEFREWDDEIDCNLIVLVKKGDEEANERYNKLYSENKKDIELYKFEQFIASKQIKENKEFRDEFGFKYINDMLVGCSKMDHWRYRDAFVEGYQIGAYAYQANPQAWDSPILHPRKLFEGSDRHLGKAGEFLKDKIDNALEFCENVRIDHVMGLIEPFVLENSSIVYGEKNEQGKRPIINDPFKNPVHAEYMSQMTGPDGKPLDDYKNYSCDYTHSDGHKTYHSNIMNEIVLPVLKDHGLDKNDPIWETICTNPEPFYDTYYNNLQLKELVQTEWSRVEGKPDDAWFLIGSHDSIPAMNMIKRDWTKSNYGWDALYLAGYLHQDSKRADESREFCDRIADDDKERVKAKFAELLTTKKFQISFADILGITDKDAVYNVGGENNDDFWKLRIPPDFIDKYYENLASDNPTAINIPEVLKTAAHAKLDMLKNQAGNDETKKEELEAKFKPIIEKLAHYEAILKE